jgi:CRP-like cAMP-binding protein
LKSLIEACKNHPLQKKLAAEPLFYQGEVPRHTYIIVEGIVKVYDIDPSGDEKIINFFSTGDILPLAWQFDKAPVSLYYYDAFSECTLIKIPRDELNEILDANPDFVREMFDHYVNSFISSLLEINALEQSKSNDKIIHMLQYLLMRFPGIKKGEWQQINLRITHQDLAGMTGLTRETTSTELNKLRRKGAVNYANQHYSLNIPKLRSLLSSEEFLNFSNT